MSGLGESTFVQVVRGQIEYPIVDPPTDAPGMPANLVEGQDADDVANYVGAVAGLEPAGATPPAAAARRRSRRRRPRVARVTPPPARRSSPLRVAAAATRWPMRARPERSGPNLDDAKPDAALVSERVSTNGKGVMPPFKDQLDAKQIADVAAYVSSVAGELAEEPRGAAPRAAVRGAPARRLQRLAAATPFAFVSPGSRGRVARPPTVAVVQRARRRPLMGGVSSTGPGLGARRLGAERRPRRASATTSAVASTKTTTPSHVAIHEATTIGAK